MKLSLGYEIIGTEYVDIEIDEDELEKPWSEMSNDEKEHFIRENYSEEAYYEAMKNCEYDIGGLFCIEEEDGSEIYCQQTSLGGLRLAFI